MSKFKSSISILRCFLVQLMLITSALSQYDTYGSKGVMLSNGFGTLAGHYLTVTYCEPTATMTSATFKRNGGSESNCQVGEKEVSKLILVFRQFSSDCKKMLEWKQTRKAKVKHYNTPLSHELNPWYDPFTEDETRADYIAPNHRGYWRRSVKKYGKYMITTPEEKTSAILTLEYRVKFCRKIKKLNYGYRKRSTTSDECGPDEMKDYEAYRIAVDSGIDFDQIYKWTVKRFSFCSKEAYSGAGDYKKINYMMYPLYQENNYYESESYPQTPDVSNPDYSSRVQKFQGSEVYFKNGRGALKPLRIRFCYRKMQSQDQTVNIADVDTAFEPMEANSTDDDIIIDRRSVKRSNKECKQIFVLYQSKSSCKEIIASETIFKEVFAPNTVKLKGVGRPWYNPQAGYDQNYNGGDYTGGYRMGSQYGNYMEDYEDDNNGIIHVNFRITSCSKIPSLKDTNDNPEYNKRSTGMECPRGEYKDYEIFSFAIDSYVDYDRIFKRSLRVDDLSEVCAKDVYAISDLPKPIKYSYVTVKQVPHNSYFGGYNNKYDDYYGSGDNVGDVYDSYGSGGHYNGNMYSGNGHRYNNLRYGLDY